MNIVKIVLVIFIVCVLLYRKEPTTISTISKIHIQITKYKTTNNSYPKMQKKRRGIHKKIEFKGSMHKMIFVVKDGWLLIASKKTKREELSSKMRFYL